MNIIDDKNISWAAACSFVIFNSNEYIDIINKFDRSLWKNKSTKH